MRGNLERGLLDGHRVLRGQAREFTLDRRLIEDGETVERTRAEFFVAEDGETEIVIKQSVDLRGRDSAPFYRTEKEALMALRGLAHVVQLIDWNDEERWLALSYEKGGNLAKCLRRDEPLELMEGLTAAAYVLGMLFELHRKNILHCDVKPTNLLLSEVAPRGRFTELSQASPGWLRFADFEIARKISTAGCLAFDPYLDNRIFGSPGWVPMEAHDCLYDPRSDMFSWAVLSWRLLRGKTPYEHPPQPLGMEWREQLSWLEKGAPRIGLPLWGAEDIVNASLHPDYRKRPMPGVAFGYLAGLLKEKGVDLSLPLPILAK